jgi:hypothetical protein
MLTYQFFKFHIQQRYPYNILLPKNLSLQLVQWPSQMGDHLQLKISCISENLERQNKTLSQSYKKVHPNKKNHDQLMPSEKHIDKIHPLHHSLKPKQKTDSFLH